ncbi:MAG TPA: trypsin-like peptidase domain-containing protein [Candidatus Binatia bacterium]|nr:trypsin-like peptidase domain-containing protein [Candidatus Binatia bacterium]
MNASVKLIEQVTPSTVAIHVTVPQHHPSAVALGTERMGSGAIIDPAGYILTVNYIAIGASTIQVTLLDDNQYEAEIAAQDFASGIAVLKIADGRFPAVPLRSSAGLQPGDEVFLIASSGEGNGRRLNGGGLITIGPFDAYWEYYLDRALICTAMNPGLGGGPMFDMNGRMVGVVSLNLGEVGKFSLAIPTEHFSEHREELLRYGRRVSRPSRAWLGMYSYPLRDHIVIAGLVPGSPGDKAGLKAGDVLLAIDGQEVSDRRQMYELLWSRRAGEAVAFRIFRNNAVRTVAVVSGNVEEFYGL